MCLQTHNSKIILIIIKVEFKRDQINRVAIYQTAGLQGSARVSSIGPPRRECRVSNDVTKSITMIATVYERRAEFGLDDERILRPYRVRGK